MHNMRIYNHEPWAWVHVAVGVNPIICIHLVTIMLDRII